MFPPDFNPNPAFNVGSRSWVRHHFDVVPEMKIVLIAAIGLGSLSCKPSYSYEGQQRGGDPYRVEWITDDGQVATCFVIETSSSTQTASTDGIVVNSLKFSP